jgi:hypothetical protein
MAPPTKPMPEALAMWIATAKNGSRAHGNTTSYARIVRHIAYELQTPPEGLSLDFYDTWLVQRAEEGRPVAVDTENRYRYAAKAWNRHRANPAAPAALAYADMSVLHPRVAAFITTIAQDGTPAKRTGGIRPHCGVKAANSKGATIQRALVLNGLTDPHKLTPAHVQAVLNDAHTRARDMGKPDGITGTRHNELVRAFQQF